MENTEIIITFKGKTPLIMHSNQTADPTNAYAKALKKISSKRAKTDEDYEEMSHIEYEAGQYRNVDMFPEGPNLYMPTENVIACLINAGKKIKHGRGSMKACVTGIIPENPIGYALETKYKNYEQMKDDPDTWFKKMGKTLFGGSKHEGDVPLGTPQQMQFLSQVLSGAGPQAGEAFQQFLQPYDPEQFQGLFQQAFVDPALQQYEQQVLPAIQQRFVEAGAGSSSALNQALGQSAADLSTMLGSQMGQFYQGQQANRLQALGLLGGLAGQRMQQPIVQQREGLLGPLIGAAGRVGAAQFGQ